MFGLAVLLFASSCEKPIEQPDPTLTLSQTEVPVPADGGTYSVAYKVTNPRDGAKVSVKAATNDWVTEFEVTGNNINFVVAANEALEQRSVDVTVSYPGATEQVFTIVQSARGLDYDYTLIGSYWSFYEAYGINGEDNYYVAFSDKPITGGYLENGSVAYILDFYVEGGSTSGRELPEGIYTLGAAGETTPMSVGADESYFTLIPRTARKVLSYISLKVQWRCLSLETPILSKVSSPIRKARSITSYITAPASPLFPRA